MTEITRKLALEGIAIQIRGVNERLQDIDSARRRQLDHLDELLIAKEELEAVECTH